MRAPLTDSILRRAWERLRMTGDFDEQMRNRAVRRAIEAAAGAMQARENRQHQRTFDLKSRAANDNA